VNWSAAEVAEVPPAVVTVMFKVPGAPTGATAVMEPSLLTVNEVAAVMPNITLVAPVKPLPLMVTLVPPAVLPVLVASEVTLGAAALLTENWSALQTSEVPLGVVTVMS
jgi:hypothetical protein